MSGPNVSGLLQALKPLVSSQSELCALLAAALLRLRSAQSSKLRSDPEDTALSNGAQQSGYAVDQPKDLLT
jgi:hypothetical protein